MRRKLHDRDAFFDFHACTSMELMKDETLVEKNFNFRARIENWLNNGKNLYLLVCLKLFINIQNYADDKFTLLSTIELRREQKL